jgi:flagellar biosynthesis/type III secretory pathway M-ring protein FliF/YscJ
MSGVEQVMPVVEVPVIESDPGKSRDYRDYIYIGVIVIISLIIGVLLILAFIVTYYKKKSDDGGDSSDEEDGEEEEEDEMSEDEESNILDKLEREIDDEKNQIKHDRKSMLKKIQPIDEVSSVEVSEA